ncbi:hypothetical protein CA54_23920 [Symmachiella macrocystis]|uniref:DUF4328 domain-containing protein n=1 Tax=Symmachiella macrocystis TaxID=2527985 RepID=A0A5C6BP67_9PLAN|nr:DUF4328 domain-containing protein [Symmachiella macrocystis]TWU13557.1 hypothetical protein CA54_23920 [Symmachiella macrocystis]
MADPTDFRDTSTLSLVLKSFLGLYCAFSLVGLWSDWLEVRMLQRMVDGAFVAEGEADANDNRQLVIFGAAIVVYLMTAVLFLRWTYLASRNARSLVAEKLEYSPGWAVGWFFVPIVNFWKPYQVMIEIFKASNPNMDDDWQESSSPPATSRWWTMWVIAIIIGRVSSRMSMRAKTLDDFLASSQVSLVVDVVCVALGIAAISLVSSLQTWQTEKYDRISTATV